MSLLPDRKPVEIAPDIWLAYVPMPKKRSWCKGCNQRRSVKKVGKGRVPLCRKCC